MMYSFEWAHGWSMKFGLYAFDPTTQTRYLRDGAKYYGQVIRRFIAPAETGPTVDQVARDEPMAFSTHASHHPTRNTTDVTEKVTTLDACVNATTALPLV